MSATATARYQTFSTTISDPDSGLDATFVVYPVSPRVVPLSPRQMREHGLPRSVLGTPVDRRSRQRAWDLAVPLDWLSLIAWPPVDTIASDPGWARSPQPLPNDPDVDFLYRFAEVLQSGQFDARGHEPFDDLVAPEIFNFSHYLVTQPLIPFRNSPLSAQALGQLIGQGSGVASGAVAGAWAGSDHGLIMLATVPGGMIVGGAAFGVGMALQQGLHDRILRWISGPTQPGEQEQA